MRKTEKSTNAPVCPLHKKPMQEIKPEHERGNRRKRGVIRALRQYRRFRCSMPDCPYVQATPIPPPKKPIRKPKIRSLKPRWLDSPTGRLRKYF